MIILQDNDACIEFRFTIQIFHVLLLATAQGVFLRRGYLDGLVVTAVLSTFEIVY